MGRGRQRVGVPDGADILEEINSWPHDRRVRGHEIIAEVEDQVTAPPTLLPSSHSSCCRVLNYSDLQHRPWQIWLWRLGQQSCAAGWTSRAYRAPWSRGTLRVRVLVLVTLAQQPGTA